MVANISQKQDKVSSRVCVPSTYTVGLERSCMVDYYHKLHCMDSSQESNNNIDHLKYIQSNTVRS